MILRAASVPSLAICVAVAAAGSAAAGDIATRSSLRLRVGETGSMGTYGGHSGDCTKSVPPEIRIVRPPALGTLSERENVPYVSKVSISGTCLGSHFLGTEMRYTAASPGSETVAFDVVFPNGADHRTVSVTVR